MVRHLFIVLGLFVGWADVLAQQQLPAEMQQQMQAADQRPSGGNDVAFATPLKAFQQFFQALQSNNPSALFATLSANGKKTIFGLSAEPTQEQFATFASLLQADGESNFVLLSFRYTDSADRPKIVVTYSSQITIDGGIATPKTQAELNLVDTATGWKIDMWQDDDIGP